MEKMENETVKEISKAESQFWAMNRYLRIGCGGCYYKNDKWYLYTNWETPKEMTTKEFREWMAADDELDPNEINEVMEAIKLIPELPIWDEGIINKVNNFFNN